MKGLGQLVDRDDARKLYRDYLRRIDAEAVLNYYGADHLHRKGDELIHSCLLDRVDPHHAHGDSNPSASMNTELKVYNCYGYGGGDVLWFMTKMEGKEEFYEIVPMLAEFLTGSTLEDADILKEMQRLLKVDPPDESIPTYNERILRRWAKYHPYLRGRGVTKETAELLQMGYDEDHARITIPHWVDGKLVGWQRRALADPRWPMTEVEHAPDGTPLDGGRIPKIKSSPAFPKRKSLYNLDRIRARGKKTLIVVESPMSVAKAESLKLDDDDILAGVVATFGASVDEAQIKLLRDFDTIYVYTDPDDAGYKGAVTLLEGLWRHTKTFYVTPEPEKDLGDHNERSEIIRLIEKAEPAALALARMKGKRNAVRGV